MGAVDNDALAYLTLRALPSDDSTVEIGVCGYGSSATVLLDRLTKRIVEWDNEMHSTGDHLWIEIHPNDAAPTPAELVRVHRRDNYIVVGRSRADALAG